MIKSQNSLTFKIYCKPTKKNDYMHFYTHHNSKSKTGFYLRAQYLNEEFEYIKHSLKSLKYLKFFIFDSRKKLLRYTRQINQRKLTPLSPSPIDRSLNPLTHIT